MKTARSFTLAVVATLIAGTSAEAGDVVVPLASNQTLQDLTYVTRVWVANPSTTAQTFTGVFYPAGADGTTEPAASPAQTTAPGQTRVYSSPVGVGFTGMLALRGADDLRVTARLETRSGDRLLGASEVRPITADTAFAAGTTAQLAGFERSAGSAITDLYLFNLDTSQAQCTLRVLRVDGSAIADTITLQLAPRQRRDFVDALGMLQQNGVTDVRMEASCDHRFWIAGLLRRVNAPATVLSPSAAVSGTLFGSGPPPPPPSDGSVVFSVPGMFLNAVRNDSYRTYPLPLVEGKAYRKSVVEFDLTAGKFPDGNFTGIHSLRRAHKQRANRILYYGLTVNNFNNRSVVDLGKNELLIKGDGPWVLHHTYHVRFTYDVRAGTVQLDIFEGSERKLSISGPAQHDDLSFDGNPVSVDFGQVGVADGAYFPPLGWQYANLRVVVTP